LRFHSVLALMGAALLAGCATLAGLPNVVQPPTFQVADDRQAEIRLLGPAVNRPLGGASVRLWARIDNPNRLGITLTALNGVLMLENQQATQVEFPLGLPMPALQDTVIPFDIMVSFSDVPQLAQLLGQALQRGEANYRLEGQLRVDAGLLGQPTFGPTTFLQGKVPVLR